MNYETLRKLFISLCVIISLAHAAIAQSKPLAAKSPELASIAPSDIKRIASIRSQNTREGSRVIITSNEVLSDYGAYRNGDSFLVLIPGAELALTEISVKGDGFTDSKVEARGTNLAFSFHLDVGVSPSINQRLNRLEVTFAVSGSAEADSGTDGLTVNDSAQNSRVGEAANPDRSGEATTATGGVPIRHLIATSVQPSAGDPAAPPVAAQPTPAGAGDNITQRDVDLMVPESPAFTVLGVNPETVTRPTTAREFATSLLNGVDQRGNFQSGVAFDFAPYLTFFGEQTSLFSYRHSAMERFLARTQLSFATTKGVTEEDKSARLGLGLRLTLWDKGDPRLDTVLDGCYTDALNDSRLQAAELRTFPGETDAQKGQRLVRRKAVLAEVVKPCNDSSRKRNWNASGWIVGVAPSWISQSGQTKDFHWNGGGFWTSLAYGFDNVSALKGNSQLIFHARYRNNEIVPDAQNKGKFFSEDSMFFGGRLRMAPGSEANSIFSLEGNYIRSRRNKGAFDSSYRYSLGLEKKLADNIWFSLALGGQSGRSDGTNQAFVLSSFKWGFSQKKGN
jgi:hypothetical protein